jgi:polar amino acid transport system substrate-binding protein
MAALAARAINPSPIWRGMTRDSSFTSGGRTFARLAFGVVLVVSLVGCASSASPSAQSSSGSDVSAQYPNAKLGGDGSFAKAVTSGLRVCTTNEAPSNWQEGGSGPWKGFDAEIANEAIARLGIKTVTYVIGPWDSMVPNLTSDRCDLLQTDIHWNPDRAKIINFTAPIFFYGDSLLLKKGNPLGIHTWADLKGHSAGCQLGSNLCDMLDARQKAANDLSEVKTYKTWDELITDLSNGRLDVGFVDATVSGYYVVTHPDAQVELATGYLPQEDLSSWTRFGVQLGAHDLANAFSAVLDEMRVDGTTTGILQKFGLDQTSIQVFKGMK